MAEEPTNPEAPQEPAPAEPVITNAETPIAPAPNTETDELKQRLATYEFKEKLGEVSKTYPHVTEFEEEISNKVKDGYSIEDASIIILNKNNRLQTAEQVARQANQGGSSGFGGSMDNPPPRDRKDPVPGEPGSADFYAKRFQELEAKGEIRTV